MYSILKKINLSLLLIFALQSNIIQAQVDGFFDCKLINSKGKTPISFATILIKNKAKGLISNSDGGFKIPYRFQKLNDTLVISSIGYSTKEVSISSFNKNLINLIVLDEKTEILNEVIITGSKKKKKKRMSPSKIVNLALDKIPANYPFTPYSYIGYYRDYQIKEGKYVNLNEALMEVFDSGFGSFDFKETQIRLYKYEKNPSFPIDTFANKPYDYKNRKKLISSKFNINNQNGNEYTILRLHDAIRNYNKASYSFIDTLNLNFVENHQLRLLPDTSIDNISLYSIGIYKSIEHIRVEGTMLISKDDFKIYKMQYAVYDKRRPVIISDSIKIKEKNLGKLLYEIILEYQSIKGTMYPNYISFRNSFESLQPTKFFLVDAKINYTKLFEPASNSFQVTFNSFQVTFNNIPLLKNAVKKRNYKLSYEDLDIKIDSIKVKNKMATLYLNEELVLSSKIVQSPNKLIEKNIIIKVKNIKDIYGNMINEQGFRSYNQFREFFVQEVKLNSSKPIGPFFMLKDTPIFNNQPIAPFNNLSDYWLNTPLKN